MCDRATIQPMVTTKEVEKLAGLARIDLSEEEKRAFSGEIEAILKYVSDIQGLETPPYIGAVNEVRNILREDGNAHESGVYSENLLSLAPVREGNYFRVKRIL